MKSARNRGFKHKNSITGILEVSKGKENYISPEAKGLEEKMRKEYQQLSSELIK